MKTDSEYIHTSLGNFYSNIKILGYTKTDKKEIFRKTAGKLLNLLFIYLKDYKINLSLE